MPSPKKKKKPPGKVGSEKSLAGKKVPKKAGAGKQAAGKKTPSKKAPPAKKITPAKKAGAGKKAPKAAAAGKKVAGKKVAKTPAKKPVKDGRAEMEKVLARLRAQIDHPENQNCVWVVELVIPPGSFMARRLEEPVDMAALNAEIKASAEALNYGNDPKRHRFVITHTDLGGVARQYAKAMCEDIPNPTVPMRHFDLFTIDAILHAQFIGDEEY